ncbi:MAG: hypothetical protein KIC92_05920 [Clostridiales bacterium]|nr:hypothetical protein [Clostridiales bacterium]
MNKEQLSKESIEVFENEVVRHLRVSPKNQVYVELNDVLKKLHFQGDYDSVISICEVVTQKVNRIR